MLLGAAGVPSFDVVAVFQFLLGCYVFRLGRGLCKPCELSIPFRMLLTSNLMPISRTRLLFQFLLGFYSEKIVLDGYRVLLSIPFRILLDTTYSNVWFGAGFFQFLLGCYDEA